MCRIRCTNPVLASFLVLSLFPMNNTPFLDADRLREVRQNTDWRKLFSALDVSKDEKKSKQHDWWGKSPLKPGEKDASFHVNDKGWYCHSTGRGGGPIELVQAVHPGMSCYDAGRWLLEHQVSFLVAETRARVETATSGNGRRGAPPDGQGAESEAPPAPARSEEETENRPIRQDLRPRMDRSHPAFAARGISQEGVLEELGAGYWERQKPRKDGRLDPLNGRLVFQVRGLRQDPETGMLKPVILTHTGRALSEEQEQQDGKWWTYPGFRKSREIYNLDLAILDKEADRQACQCGYVIIVEGCFDVAKLWAAGIRNVVATFGARLCEEQIPRVDLLSEMIGVERFLVFYDRDQDGTSPHGRGAVDAVELLGRHGFEADVFDWSQTFPSPSRGEVAIPPEITDPAEFSVEQLRWLRKAGLV